MATDILKEFLVAIGYKVDEPSQRKAMAGIAAVGKDLAKLAVAAEAVAVGVVAAMAKVSQSFEAAYYASSRTGSSVRELKGFAYAVSQLGGSAEGAMASVEGLAQKIRDNPGFGNLLKEKFGIDPKNAEKAVEELAKRFSKMPNYIAKQYGDMLGIDERTRLAMQSPELNRLIEEYNAKIAKLGFNPEKAAADGKKFAQQYRSLTESIGIITDRVISNLVNDPEKPLEKLTAYLDAHGAEIAVILEKIAKAFLKIFDALVQALPKIDAFVEGHGGWEAALAAIGAVLLLKVVPGLSSMVGLLSRLMFMTPPAWMLGMLGLTAYAGVKIGDAASGGFDKGFNAATPGANTPEMLENQKMSAWGRVKRIYGRVTGQGVPLQGNEAIRRRGRAGRGGVGGWWTPDRQKHAFEMLTSGGMPEASAVALISRWKNVESTKDGPNAVNGIGATGIAQWLGGRKPGSFDFDDQLKHALHEYQTGSGDGRGVKASTALRNARTDRDAAIGASAYERAEGYNPGTGIDNFTGTTLAGMAEVRRNVRGGIPPIVKIKPGTELPLFHPDMSSGVKPNALFKPNAALGGGANDNSRVVTINQTNHNHVSGVSDPTTAAGQIGARQDRHGAALVRNMQSAIG